MCLLISLIYIQFFLKLCGVLPNLMEFHLKCSSTCPSATPQRVRGQWNLANERYAWETGVCVKPYILITEFKCKITFCFTAWKISAISTACRVDICVFLHFFLLQCISRRVSRCKSKPRLTVENRGFREALWCCLAPEEKDIDGSLWM